MANSIGVGLLGLGTVGSAVAERLTRSPRLMAKLIGTEIRLHRVAVRDPAKHRPVELPDEVLTTDPDEVVNDPEVDVVVEVMGGLEPARQMIQASLQGGKSVVTANKAVIARDGPALAGTATGNAGLWFEAAVGGAVPIISLLRHALLADRIGEVRGVVNGTTNFILGEMQKSGSTLEAAVAEAQRRGYAEADPSGDIDGDDAADKLAILVWLAFGMRLDQASIPREGIRALQGRDVRYASLLDSTVKLVASASLTAGSLTARVAPTLVPLEHPLAAPQGAENTITVTGDLSGPAALRGMGAGGRPTASAILSDLVAACQAHLSRTTPTALPQANPAPLLSDEEAETAGYLRIIPSNEAEAPQLVVQALEDRGIPIEASVSEDAQLLVLTRAAPRATLDRALETLDSIPAVESVACRLDRIEAASS